MVVVCCSLMCVGCFVIVVVCRLMFVVCVCCHDLLAVSCLLVFADVSCLLFVVRCLIVVC